MSQVILPRTGILAFMDDDSRKRLATYGSVISTSPGHVLIQNEEVNGNLYVVLAGMFNVTTMVRGKTVLLDTMREGDCLGEIAIFHPNKASATVIGLQAGELWMIDAAALQEFLLTWPNDACAVILGINIILSRRLKKANSLIRANEIVPSFLSVRSQKHIDGS
jgi:CRP-like cAMP-binding protein